MIDRCFPPPFVCFNFNKTASFGAFNNQQQDVNGVAALVHLHICAIPTTRTTPRKTCRLEQWEQQRIQLNLTKRTYTVKIESV